MGGGGGVEQLRLTPGGGNHGDRTEQTAREKRGGFDSICVCIVDPYSWRAWWTTAHVAGVRTGS